MSKGLTIILAALVVSFAVILLLPAQAPGSGEPQPVIVTNFPESQRVEGAVFVEGVVHQATLASLKEIEVPPVAPSDSRRLVAGGVVPTDGFGAVVLSLIGQTKGTVRQQGQVGAILIPDEEPIVRAFEEKSLFQFPMEVKADVALSAAYFNSNQPRYVVGFPRYRVLLYNTSDRAVTVDIYAYLTN